MIRTARWLALSLAAHPALAAGTLDGLIRADHFGWRPTDTKIALLLGNGGATVEVRRSHDDSVVGTYTAGSETLDEDSGDNLAAVDFSTLTETGSFYLYVPALDARSYDFDIAEEVYNIVGRAAVKSFYFQRCNHDKALPHASDALGRFAATGRQWVDGACHAGDLAAGPGPGCPDHGPLDLGGGWHDAGDYQKTLWGRGVAQLLWAYDLNPQVWGDGQLTIPEAGNDVPDILDEAAWELDFYTRMQRPDGHFMTSVKGRGADPVSPPSLNPEVRVYFDCTSPAGGGWSGGGCTIVEATAHATAVLAHAAALFAGLDATRAAAYRRAALDGWSWLGAHAGTGQRQPVCMAAAAVWRLDTSVGAARDWVHACPWSTWDGELPWSVSPSSRWLTAAAWHYLSTPGRDAGVEATVREAVRQAIVARAFDQRGAYGGLYGSSADGWDWSWGSNSNQGSYGSNLAIADRFGVRDGHPSSELIDFAQSYLHYLLGRNPLNMVYMTNMAGYGGEHSSFQIYHAWFSHTGGDGDHGNADFNGKPAAVTEPLYPYYPADTQISVHGPAPGLVPGGPNWYYSGTYEIPNRTFPAYAYRDWSVGCDWNGSACASSSWEVTENDTRYQGPLVLLVSFFMSPFNASPADGGPSDGAPSDGGGGDPSAADGRGDSSAADGRGDRNVADGGARDHDDPTAVNNAVVSAGCGCASSAPAWPLLGAWWPLRRRRRGQTA